jgi:copper(I)-binding protein
VTRWNRRLLFGAIAMLVPALAGCEAGLNAPTLEFHPASVGVSSVTDGITIDNAFVLGPALNATLPAGGRAGVFLALQAQNGDKLLSVSAPGTASAVQVTGGTLDLPSQSLVDLEGPAPQVVLTGLTKPLAGGETIQLVFDFASVGAVTLNVPVEPQAYAFTTYSAPATPSPTASVKPKAGATPSVSPSASGSASAGASASPAGSPSPTSSGT